MDFEKPDIESEERAGDVTRAKASEPMAFNSWAAQPTPRRRTPSSSRDGVDFDALKIFLILAGLTAGMALGLRLLF